MSLFQKSVEKKYLNDLDSELIEKKYADFQNYFGNPERQENIRNSKEEQFQEGFLRELFVKILGYTLNPEPNFNLTTELKNISNSKKADGAIFKQGDASPCEVTAVIELKGTDTADLDKIETQAFGYKNHHPKCKYIITSNFEKLRFYIQNAVDHVDFDLFSLSKEQFSLIWLCLAKDNLLADLPLKIKESSVLQEENITKKLYADYSKFREAIYNNLVKNNPETDKLLLFNKTQKLLDRFLFIFFAEDRLLVPPNSISQIIEKWKDDVDFGDAKPLYYTFKKYFHVLNVGRPKSGTRQEIYAYNGGLFQPDEILDTISIDDDILHEHTLRLSNYDFETDVDVNILGHIFEHSLGEIENVQAEIASGDANKGLQPLVQKQGTSKRKKDGIFYTPKYITKYIVENTVGKLCEEKRTELENIAEMFSGIKCYEVGKGNPPQTPQIRDEKPFTREFQVDSKWLPFFEGKHIERYQLSWNQNSWINYGNWLAAPREIGNFKDEKILIRKIVGSTLICNYVPYTSYCNTLLFVLKLTSKSNVKYQSLLGILNSKFIGWYYRHKFQISDDDTFPQIMIRDILKFPIPNNNSVKIENYVSNILEQMSLVQKLKNKFIGLLKDNLEVGKITKNLESFNKSDFKNLLSELKKQKIILSLSDQSKWKDFFESSNLEINKLQLGIEKTDKEIDQMVYKLYGLTEEEIKIVGGKE